MTVSRPDHTIEHLADIEIAAASVTRRVKTDNTHLVPNEDLTTNLAIDTPGINPPTEQPRDADTGSSEDLDVVVWVDLEESDLYIYHDETDAALDTWDKDSKRVREEWKKQLEEFDKRIQIGTPRQKPMAVFVPSCGTASATSPSMPKVASHARLVGTRITSASLGTKMRKPSGYVNSYLLPGARRSATSVPSIWRCFVL
jgi:hypothetical protein